MRKGEFVPEATARTCYQAQARADGFGPEHIAEELHIDHCYIEALELGDDGIFLLTTGS